MGVAKGLNNDEDAAANQTLPPPRGERHRVKVPLGTPSHARREHEFAPSRSVLFLSDITRMSLIAPRDIQCTLRFAVGQRFCVATLQFAKDEDAADVVRKFLSEENIPVYLHDSIYSTVKTMIWDEVDTTIRESENSAHNPPPKPPSITIFESHIILHYRHSRFHHFHFWELRFAACVSDSIRDFIS
jgi:hypothetical protein